MLTLTGHEIRDLAEAVGLVVEERTYGLELETEMTVIPCPDNGVLDEDRGTGTHYRYVAYNAEYPEDGVYGLGNELSPNIG